MKKALFIAGITIVLIACNNTDQQADSTHNADSANHSGHQGDATTSIQSADTAGMHGKSMMSIMQNNME